MDNKIELTPGEFTRLLNNFYQSNNIAVDPQRMATDSHLFNYIVQNHHITKQKYKVALCFICLNPPYWEFINNAFNSARQYFLPGHDVDFFLWSDLPEENVKAGFPGVKYFNAEPIEWPYPTLMRYTLLLQQEEALSAYDYVFYCDIDMLFVNVVGDEVLGKDKGITAAQHPMYATRKELWPPYEPNPQSASYIPRPGMIIQDEGKPRFMPLYFAGGFQGGGSKAFITAMKETRKIVNKDLDNNYIPIWNDETAWNRHLFENPPEVVLTPAYIYPDSLIKEYYEPIVWGQSYPPKLVTLTKKFTVSKEGGEAVAKMIAK